MSTIPIICGRSYWSLLGASMHLMCFPDSPVCLVGDPGSQFEFGSQGANVVLAEPDLSNLNLKAWEEKLAELRQHERRVAGIIGRMQTIIEWEAALARAKVEMNLQIMIDAGVAKRKKRKDYAWPITLYLHKPESALARQAKLRAWYGTDVPALQHAAQFHRSLQAFFGLPLSILQAPHYGPDGAAFARLAHSLAQQDKPDAWSAECIRRGSACLEAVSGAISVRTIAGNKVVVCDSEAADVRTMLQFVALAETADELLMSTALSLGARYLVQKLPNNDHCVQCFLSEGPAAMAKALGARDEEVGSTSFWIRSDFSQLLAAMERFFLLGN